MPRTITGSLNLGRNGKWDFSGLPASPYKLYHYSTLTPLHRRFVDEFVVCQNGAEAARRSGLKNALTVYALLLSRVDIRCAIRERMETITDLASVSAADIRRQLKLINETDATEISGVWKVPCRHCHGHHGQFQYTNAEMIYIEQAHAYGEQGWPSNCVTKEYGPELHSHAMAAWYAGEKHRTLDLKGGDGYSRNRDINPDCCQCDGQGIPLAYICDTRRLSDGARQMFKGVKFMGDRIELLTIDRENIRNLLARDVQVGVERKELTINLPRTPEEFEKALAGMSQSELEQFVANMVTLTEEEYHEIEAASLPAPAAPKRFVRRAAPRS